MKTIENVVYLFVFSVVIGTVIGALCLVEIIVERVGAL